MISVWTDGSNYKGKGGCAAILIGDNFYLELSKYVPVATNNIAELEGINLGLSHILLNRGTEENIVVWTDSKYCVGVLTYDDFCKDWIYRASKNLELVSKIRIIVREFKSIEFKHIPGHTDMYIYNELADRLANKARLEGVQNEYKLQRESGSLEEG
jgi:ribonuclease HI